MKTAKEKLDHANFLRKILTDISDETVGIAKRFDNGNWAGSYETALVDHPKVQKFHSELVSLVSVLKKEIQKEMDEMFK